MTEYFAVTAFGLERVLEEELKALGVTRTSASRGGVQFYASNEGLYKSLLWLRTAQRVLQPIRTFEANTADQLYKQAYDINWPALFDVSSTFAVDGLLTGRKIQGLHHSGFVKLKFKDAVVDRFRKENGERPNVDKDHPQIMLHLRLSGNKCTLSVDAAGRSMHLRGYRSETLEAPLKETLAAGLLMLSAWKPGIPLIDPLCGSGTLPIEAALWAKGIAPGSFNPDFSLRHWKNFDSDLFKKLLVSAKESTSIPSIIQASDKQVRALTIAKANAKRAGLDEEIIWKTSSFESLDSARTEPGFLIFNPPYGERISDQASLPALYSKIGESLRRYSGWKAGILVADPGLIKNIGHKPDQSIPLFNGAIECRLALFHL